VAVRDRLERKLEFVEVTDGETLATQACRERREVGPVEHVYMRVEVVLAQLYVCGTVGAVVEHDDDQVDMMPDGCVELGQATEHQATVIVCTLRATPDELIFMGWGRVKAIRLT